MMVNHDDVYLSLNATMVEQYGLSPYDTTFANNWIRFNNNLVNAYNSGEGTKEALTPLTEGIFSWPCRNHTIFDPIVINSS